MGMRRTVLRPDILILVGCFSATLLSGHTLFSSGVHRGVSWLDAVFLMAIVMGVLVGVGMMSRGATGTVERYMDEVRGRTRE